MRRLHLPIQNPCHEDWTAMESDGESRRFCDVCTKHVHDISAMTEETARSVLASESAKGRVCVRYTLDGSGNIKFKPQTIEAPNLWRMTVAAAGMAMTLLTGCVDAKPDRIVDDKCVYEVGPWSFTNDRGQGTCPAAEAEPEPEPMMMGELEAVIEPPEPIREVKGDIAPPEPTVVEPPPPEHVRMGKIPAPPEPAVEIEMMGDIAGPVDQPCDPEPQAVEQREGPRRI